MGSNPARPTLIILISCPTAAAWGFIQSDLARLPKVGNENVNSKTQPFYRLQKRKNSTCITSVLQEYNNRLRFSEVLRVHHMPLTCIAVVNECHMHRVTSTRMHFPLEDAGIL